MYWVRGRHSLVHLDSLRTPTPLAVQQLAALRTMNGLVISQSPSLRGGRGSLAAATVARTNLMSHRRTLTRDLTEGTDLHTRLGFYQGGKGTDYETIRE